MPEGNILRKPGRYNEMRNPLPQEPGQNRTCYPSPSSLLHDTCTKKRQSPIVRDHLGGNNAATIAPVGELDGTEGKLPMNYADKAKQLQAQRLEREKEARERQAREQQQASER